MDMDEVEMALENKLAAKDAVPVEAPVKDELLPLVSVEDFVCHSRRAMCPCCPVVIVSLSSKYIMTLSLREMMKTHEIPSVLHYPQPKCRNYTRQNGKDDSA
jgi:hypothetical protein